MGTNPAPSRAHGSDEAMRLAPINGLRGIAILAVVYFHVVCGLWPASAVPVWASPLLTNGWTGVNLFFILSGFVLFLPYAAGERSMQTPRDRLGFYRRRALRLMPLFYVAVIGQWLVTAAQGGSTKDFFPVLSLAFIFDPGAFTPTFNTALWSIGVEIAFSVLFPFLVEMAGKRHLGRLLAGVLALALVMRIAGIHRNPALNGATFNSDMFLCRLDEFVLGMMVARLYVSKRLPARAGWCALAGTILVGCAWIGFDQVLRGGLPPLSRAVLNDVLDAGLFFVICAALIRGHGLASILAWRPLQVLGMMCYSIYIWHTPLLGWLMPHRTTMPPAAFVSALAVFAVVTLALAAFTYRFVEFRRIRDWRSLFLLPPATVEALA